ncbi:ADP-ribose pyrophosphatase [Bacillus coahuilensis p1.1.43]|uniref:ADP-ribose pyrophosphatase n=1 Tax=Bacillus coahuilensis p1.1.43 TaxID=1150625 RepID=A0A147KBY8_9BACI|nr:NUDIX hydrolase [Bacillus coahuilensis]KUP08980.1 ADP-ribose pyrophosphatase [Bacillus coahuilensis p1.1.43]
MQNEEHVNAADALKNYNSKDYVTPDGYTADIVVFTVASKKIRQFQAPSMELKILLIKRGFTTKEGNPNIEGGKWALPGGFVDYRENGALAASKRELLEETGVGGFHLQHVGFYDTPGRDPRGWIISNSFYAVVPEEVLRNKKADDDAIEVDLFTMEEAMNLPLAFDHRNIIEDASRAVKKAILETTVAKYFLPKHFTVSELRSLLSLVTNEPLVKTDSALSRKINQLPFIELVTDDDGQPIKEARHSKQPTRLYRFKDRSDQDFVRSIYSSSY